MIIERRQMLLQDTRNWTYDEFRTLMLVHASHADLDYSIVERKFILGLTDEKTLSDIEQVYDTLGDGELIQLLQQLKPEFIKSSDDKETLLADVARLMAADNQFSALEINLLTFLNRIL